MSLVLCFGDERETILETARSLHLLCETDAAVGLRKEQRRWKAKRLEEMQRYMSIARGTTTSP